MTEVPSICATLNLMQAPALRDTLNALPGASTIPSSQAARVSAVPSTPSGSRHQRNAPASGSCQGVMPISASCGISALRAPANRVRMP